MSVKGEWITNPDHIKEIFVEHFEQRFKREKSTLWFKIEGLQVNIISPQVARKLEERFQNSEIKEALFSIDPGKSPGPDGLNGFYLRNFWEVLQEDIIRFHKVFYEEYTLPKGINSSFLTLIPKISNTRQLQDYHPISLINCTHKILLKLLANNSNLLLIP